MRITSEIGGLTIPSRYRSGFAKLLQLREDELEDLNRAFSSVAPALRPPDAALRVAALTTRIPGPDVVAITELVLSLYVLRENTEMRVDRLVEVVWDAVEQDEELRQINKLAIQDFGRRLKELLSHERTLGLTAKSVTLLSEHEHRWCSGRVLTDLRPVFGDNPETFPAGVVITHVLRVHYHDADDLKEFYLALDEDDLSELADIISRAQVKAQSLRALLKEKGIHYLNPELPEQPR